MVTVPAIQPGAIVRGPTLPEAIEVLATVPMGDSLKVIGRGMRTGMTHDPVLSPQQLAQLVVSAAREPFDGDARLFRLGVEAHRLGLAYEYDPYFSLSIARVDPLPHQLEAVYGYFMRLPPPNRKYPSPLNGKWDRDKVSRFYRAWKQIQEQEGSKARGG